MAPGLFRRYARAVDFDEALQLLSALQREGVRYVLVGSMALAAQGLVRATRGIDIFVAADEDNVARLRRSLEAVFPCDPSIEEITAEDLGGDYPAIQYTPPHGQYSVDILARLGERWTFDDVESERLDPDNIRRACALMVWARRLRPHRLTPGLEKRRSTSATEPDETPGAPEAV